MARVRIRHGSKEIFWVETVSAKEQFGTMALVTADWLESYNEACRVFDELQTELKLLTIGVSHG